MAVTEEPEIDMDDLQAAIDASAHATLERRKKPVPELVEETSVESAETPVAKSVVKVEVKKHQMVGSDTNGEPTVEPDGSDMPSIVGHAKKKVAPLSQEDKTEDVAIAAEEGGAEESEPSPEPEAYTEVEAKIASKPEEPPTVGDKVIKPIESEQKAEESAPETKENKPEAKPAAAEDEADFKIEGLEATQVDVKAEAEAAEQNAVKVYDTKEYNLPIKANKHHRKGHMPKWFIIAVVIIVGGAGAGYYYLFAK